MIYFFSRIVFFFIFLFVFNPIKADLIKNITTIQGVRYNQLLGYGLVIGLTNTGDRNSYTNQSLKSLLDKYSINIPKHTRINANNVAAVMVEALLPPFAKLGQTIDVTVSSIGNARSLRNGTLITTPLKGVDGNIYAIAQGSLVVSGVRTSGINGGNIIVNATNVGTISSGATVERLVPNNFGNNKNIVLNLEHPDFTTSINIANAINNQFNNKNAVSVDAGSIIIKAPRKPEDKVRLISKINMININPGKPKAKVVVNSRTGTVIMNSNVRVLPVAISEGNLVVNVIESNAISQPSSFSFGQTKIIQNSRVNINKEQTPLKILKTGPTLKDVIHGLNEVGASKNDLIQVLQLLKEIGALNADLIIK